MISLTLYDQEENGNWNVGDPNDEKSKLQSSKPLLNKVKSADARGEFRGKIVTILSEILADQEIKADHARERSKSADERLANLEIGERYKILCCRENYEK